MVDWARLTLFCYIMMRMSGFVLFNPILGRRGIAPIVQAGFILVLSLAVFSFTPGGVEPPAHLIVFVVHLILELFLGFALGLVIHIFFYIPQLAGEAIDTQMGFTMAKIYDAGAQSSLTVTSSLINLLMFLIFFLANGHYTLMRILLSSGDVIAFGSAAFNTAMTNAILELFIHCTILAVKLALPILAAEMMGQIGMGILMKVIPQINVFVINIDLKVLIGLFMLTALLSPFTNFLLQTENEMLTALSRLLDLARPSM